MRLPLFLLTLILTIATAMMAHACGLSASSYCPSPVVASAPYCPAPTAFVQYSQPVQFATPVQYAMPSYQSYAAPVQFAAPACPQVGLESYTPSYGYGLNALSLSNYGTFGVNSYGLGVGFHRRSRAVIVGERGVRVDVRRGVGRTRVKVRVRRRR